jgi:DNA-binding transcriptional regulator PaaX
MDIHKNKTAQKILKLLSEYNNTEGSIKIMKWYTGETRQERYRIRKIFNELGKLELINFLDNETENKKIILSDAGKKFCKGFEIDNIQIPKMVRWDKKWRIVFFTIPENLKKRRNKFIKILQRTEFFPIQGGAWIHPFDCKNEIELLIEALEVKPYVKFAEVIKTDFEEILLKNFSKLLEK